MVHPRSYPTWLLDLDYFSDIFFLPPISSLTIIGQTWLCLSSKFCSDEWHFFSPIPSIFLLRHSPGLLSVLAQLSSQKRMLKSKDLQIKISWFPNVAQFIDVRAHVPTQICLSLPLPTTPFCFLLNWRYHLWLGILFFASENLAWTWPNWQIAIT